MDNNSEYLETVTSKERRKDMSDVLLARRLVEDIGGKRRVSDMLYSAYRTLDRMFPHADEPHKQWTERRLKSWWNRESENVQHYQMMELFEAAQKAKEEQALLQAARREYADFIAKTARLAAFIEHQDEAFHGPQIDALRGQMGRVDLSRDGGNGE